MKGLNSFAWVAVACCGFVVASVGCYKPNSATQPQAAVEEEHHDDDGHDHGKKDAHDHSGWWCAEHGVPEEVCGLCSPKVAAEMKAKGDWCDLHNRPKSQCFICDPKKALEFAALYEAKYGKEPPKPE